MSDSFRLHGGEGASKLLQAIANTPLQHNSFPVPVLVHTSSPENRAVLHGLDGYTVTRRLLHDCFSYRDYLTVDMCSM